MSENTKQEDETQLTIDEHPIELGPDEPFVAVEIMRFERKASGLSKRLPSQFSVWSRDSGQYIGPRTTRAEARKNARSWNEQHRAEALSKQNAADLPPIRSGRRLGGR